MSKADMAVELFKNGCNCSQSVVTAFADYLGISFEDAMRFSEAFGGGLGRMRRTCGAVSGMCMLAGLKYSKSQPNDLKTRAQVYETVQKLVKRFEEKNGSSICSELLGANKPADNGSVPTPRTEEFYKKRPCISCIKDCAEIAEELLFSDMVQ